MTASPLDHPLILSTLFYPRPARSGGSRVHGALDGTIPVGDGIEIGYRLFPTQPGKPVILYFHGNGEIAPDYDSFAPEYHRAGASLLVADYRGYGWSTGEPLASALLPDAEAVADALPEVLRGAGVAGSPVILMGRSLGSAPAIHLAQRGPSAFGGLVLESGFAHTIPLLMRLGLPAALVEGQADPLDNAGKMARVELPLLVIHGEADQLIPVAQGQSLYDASPAAYKRILRVRGAGHNDLLFYAPDQYFAAIAELIGAVVG